MRLNVAGFELDVRLGTSSGGGDESGAEVLRVVEEYGGGDCSVPPGLFSQLRLPQLGRSGQGADGGDTHACTQLCVSIVCVCARARIGERVCARVAHRSHATRGLCKERAYGQGAA